MYRRCCNNIDIRSNLQRRDEYRYYGLISNTIIYINQLYKKLTK